MLARPEVQSYQYSFAGSITLVFASGVGLCFGQPQLRGEERLSRYNRRMTNLAALILFLTTCLAAVAQKLPTVAVLSTGGTIASKHDSAKGGTYRAPELAEAA